MPTLYEILKIDKNATLGEIKDAYKKLSLKWHPDSFDRGNSSAKTKEEADEMFKKIKDAYEILSDPQKRSEYDSSTGNAQQWLVNYLKKRFSNQESSPYTISAGGRRTYNPSKAVTNPRFKVDSLDDIRNKNLEGSLSLADFTNLKSLDLSGNRITSLDLNNCPNLQVIRCDNNPINNLKFVDKNIEIHFSQDELLRDNKEFKILTEELSRQVSDLEKEKNPLNEQIVKLKNVNKEDKELSENKIKELKEKNEKQKQDLENHHRTLINELKTKYNQEIQKNKNVFDWELNQERSKYNSLNSEKNNLEKNWEWLESELQKSNQDLSTSETQRTQLERELTSKKNELKNTLRNHQLETKQVNGYISSLEEKILSLQEEVAQQRVQLESLKMQKLENQKSELTRLVANLKGRLNIYQKDSLDDLLKAREELNKNSSSSFAQEKFEKAKKELTKKLDEKEITNILAKQGEVWQLQLEFLNESSRTNLKVNLETDIKKQQEHFDKLLDSAKDKLKKSKKLIKKDDDYQSYLEEFLNLQSLIVHSDNNQEIYNYLLERQSQLRQSFRRKLDDKELEEIRLAKEELTKLEIQKSVLTNPSNSNKQEYQSQIQVPPK